MRVCSRKVNGKIRIIGEGEKGGAFAETLLNELDSEEIAAAKYYRLMDEEGQDHYGDRTPYQDRTVTWMKNRLYEVYRVRGTMWLQRDIYGQKSWER